MASFRIKPYVEAKVTPDVKEDIQGEDVTVDEKDFVGREEYWKQKIVEDFINWLKGKPSKLTSHTNIEITTTTNEKLIVKAGEKMSTIFNKLYPGVEETELETLWKEASRVVEDESRWRRIFGELTEELGRTPTLLEMERRL